VPGPTSPSLLSGRNLRDSTRTQHGHRKDAADSSPPLSLPTRKPHLLHHRRSLEFCLALFSSSLFNSLRVLCAWRPVGRYAKTNTSVHFCWHRRAVKPPPFWRRVPAPRWHQCCAYQNTAIHCANTEHNAARRHSPLAPLALFSAQPLDILNAILTLARTNAVRRLLKLSSSCGGDMATSVNAASFACISIAASPRRATAVSVS